AQLPAGAWLAVQVPGNFDAPSHRALREVAAAPEWQDRLAGLAREPGSVLEPSGYAGPLLDAGCSVDAWETTYLHLLPVVGREHPVLSWMEGTALRPIRAALVEERDWARFRDQLRAALSQAYPQRGGLVHFPFRRIFVVARTAAP
ncbi:MAG TPA: trans-aconitate 2-methyltransferase, partial [Micromonosporaceae bacterium]